MTNGLGDPRLRATLIRLALTEAQVLTQIPAGEGWRKVLAQINLPPEDGWALANAAQLLAQHPDPDLWGQMLTRET